MVSSSSSPCLLLSTGPHPFPNKLPTNNTTRSSSLLTFSTRNFTLEPTLISFMLIDEDSSDSSSSPSLFSVPSSMISHAFLLSSNIMFSLNFSIGIDALKIFPTTKPIWSWPILFTFPIKYERIFGANTVAFTIAFTFTYDEAGKIVSPPFSSSFTILSSSYFTSTPPNPSWCLSVFASNCSRTPFFLLANFDGCTGTDTRTTEVTHPVVFLCLRSFSSLLLLLLLLFPSSSSSSSSSRRFRFIIVVGVQTTFFFLF